VGSERAEGGHFVCIIFARFCSEEEEEEEERCVLLGVCVCDFHSSIVNSLLLMGMYRF
jgi:hypothetical protein